MTTILLLVLSNVFMTFAWYGHLKYGHAWPLWKAIAVSWAIALLDYRLGMPAQDRSRGRDNSRLHRIRGRVPEGEARVELSRGVRLSCLGRVLRLCVQGTRTGLLNGWPGARQEHALRLVGGPQSPTSMGAVSSGVDPHFRGRLRFAVDAECGAPEPGGYGGSAGVKRIQS